MKILFVSGDDDYAALTFEKEVGLEKAKALIAEGKPVEGDGFNAQVLEFGEIDPKFIDFISDEIQDYDDSKQKNFYIL